MPTTSSSKLLKRVPRGGWARWCGTVDVVAGEDSSATVVVAILVNLGIAIAKGVAGALSGSAAMVSESAHSIADTINEVLLLVGVRRSSRPADDTHPFGYGRELYFWTLLTAVGI